MSRNNSETSAIEVVATCFPIDECLPGIVEEKKDVKKLLEVVLRKSNTGWDYVTEGLIKLGFILLDCPGPESDVGVFILGFYEFHIYIPCIFNQICIVTCFHYRARLLFPICC